MLELAFAAVLFVGTHLGISSTPLRALPRRLSAALGVTPMPIRFSRMVFLAASRPDAVVVMITPSRPLAAMVFWERVLSEAFSINTPSTPLPTPVTPS